MQVILRYIGFSYNRKQAYATDMTRLHLDYETASEANLKKTGGYRYAEDPSTRVLMLGWAYDDDEPELWLPHLNPMPSILEEGLRDPEVIKYAFNANFERLITRDVVGIDVPIEQWRCNMVASFYLGFTGGLGKVLEAIGLSDKDKRGGQLINLFCSPAPKNHKADWYDWENKPKEWEEFCQYCITDVKVERELYHYLKKFPAMQSWDWRQWFLDQKINDRGSPMDVELAEAAIVKWDKEVISLKQKLIDLTGIPKATRGPFKKYLENVLGYELESTRKDYLRTIEVSGVAAEALETWLQMNAKASSKYKAVVNATCKDDRLRGAFQYKGAARTDRVGGRIVQLQNLKRPFASIDEIEELVEDIKC